jgi:hypothetical protein
MLSVEVAGVKCVREAEKKFEVDCSRKAIGEGDSVAECDISSKDLCGQAITLASTLKIVIVSGSHTLWRWRSAGHASITSKPKLCASFLADVETKFKTVLLVVQLVLLP